VRFLFSIRALRRSEGETREARGSVDPEATGIGEVERQAEWRCEKS
jgi:hypothetical protein